MRLTDLLGAKIVSESGDTIGHVYDVQVKRDPRSSADRVDQKWRLDALLYGRSGLVVRFGLLAARQRVSRDHHDELPWSDVVAIGDSTITVRDTGAERK
jgi:sporulation protein YlmC with PRC-barrel domain